MGIRYHTSGCDATRPRVADRKFRPAELYGVGFELDSTDYEDLRGERTFVPCDMEDPCEDCGRLQRHTDSLIIAVDGACRGNGTTKALSAIGVYFAKDSSWNSSTPVYDPTPSNQKAELRACLRALATAIAVKVHEMEHLSQIVIKADSEYVVKGMTEWIFKWETNGYKTSKGVPVTNADLFQDVNQMVTKLNQHGVEVLFWHVPRSQNKEADALANAGFDVKPRYFD
ncbi:MAG: hypothetical protein Q9187_007223 [Circinaria calcarea]